MLYQQNSNLVKYIFEKVSNFEKINNSKVLFISTIGSHSKEIGREDSDYDLRCLYIKNNFKFLEKKFLHDEKKIRFRIFNNKSVCNCIPFWEISAFLNFLYEPYINNGYKYKLIKNVYWTFKSDFTFDPYNLQKVLLPLIEKLYSPKDDFNYVLDETINFIEMIDNDDFNRRNLLESIYGVIYLEWLVINKKLPPISIYKLLETKGEKEYQFVSELINKIKKINLNNSQIINLKKDIKFFVSGKISLLNKQLINKELFMLQNDKFFNLNLFLSTIKESIKLEN